MRGEFLLESGQQREGIGGAAGESGGMYISHIRSEGNSVMEALDELITIAREANIRAEVYHLKSSGQANSPLFDDAIAMIERARAEGLEITADVYTYPAGSTGLNAAIPPWVQEGGFEASLARMQDAELRDRIAQEMIEPSTEWDNMYLGAGTPDNILLVAFKNDALKPLTGMTLAEVAARRGTSPEDTIIDLVIEDDSRVATAYFLMSEENIAKKIAQPWMAFGSDAESLAPEGVFLKSNPHPRAYGTFARLLGRYVREEQVIPLAEGEKDQRIREADGYRLKRINEAEGDVARFSALLAEYSKAPEVTRRRIYLETLQEVMPAIRSKIIVDEQTHGILPLLNLDTRNGDRP